MPVNICVIIKDNDKPRAINSFLLISNGDGSGLFKWRMKKNACLNTTKQDIKNTIKSVLLINTDNISIIFLLKVLKIIDNIKQCC
jgi:hypothetical protein